MTSELMLKITVASFSIFMLSKISVSLMLDHMDESEMLLITMNPKRMCRHKWLMIVGLTRRVMKLVTAVCAVITAVLWLMGA